MYSTFLLLLQENTFQLVLATDGMRSFALFLYLDDGIQWPNANFQPSVTSGYDAGDGINFYLNPLSETVEIGDIEETSNVGVDGLYIFQMDGNFTGSSAVLSYTMYTVGIYYVIKYKV